jgi:hypothetical protein
MAAAVATNSFQLQVSEIVAYMSIYSMWAADIVTVKVSLLSVRDRSQRSLD